MSVATYFTQRCPVCGRALEIRVEYLGRKVACQHCRGQFLARDPASVPVGNGDSYSIMDRVDELLARTDQSELVHPHIPHIMAVPSRVIS